MKKILIILNNECNMNCSYCFLKKAVVQFNEDKVLSAIDSILDNSEENFICSFVPDSFSHIDVLEDICHKLLNKYKNIKFRLLTNGLGIVPISIPTSKIEVVISIDGGETTQNTFRGHFKEIAENINKYRDLYNLQTAVVTLNPETVERMSEDAIYLWDVLQFKNIFYSFNMDNAWPRKALDELAIQIESIFNEYISNKRYIKYNTDLFSATETNLYDGSKDFCKLIEGKNIAIKRDGTLVPCYLLQNETMESVQRFTYDFMLDDECKACEYLSQCRTCPAVSEKKNKYNCEFVKLKNKYTKKFKRYKDMINTFPIRLTDEQAERYFQIFRKIQCSKKALKSSIIPKDASNENIKKFLNSVVSIQAGYLWLEEDWWNAMVEIYQLEEIKDKIDYNMYTRSFIIKD